MIQVEGRDLASRFVPAVHPVFPRTYFDNALSPERTIKEPVTKHFGIRQQLVGGR